VINSCYNKNFIEIKTLKKKKNHINAIKKIWRSKEKQESCKAGWKGQTS